MEELSVIDLQNKARPCPGRIENYWFENEHIGLERTRFHRIVIPFEPFDSGLKWAHQPEATELVIEWINLGLEDPADLNGVVIAMGSTRDVEASIYLGSAHNWTDIKELRLIKEADHYRIQCNAILDFENEGVARNEPFVFETTAKYVGESSH
ncbi:MAG: hypothetical protein JNJ91_09595 [Flavobacteriales bacterium]|nr:hypothetical protein [Flavobacteriales bacterium]